MTDYTTYFSQTASAEEIYCLSETLRAENACQKANDSVVLLLMSETSREVSVVEGQPSSCHFLKTIIPEGTRTGQHRS